MELFSFARLFLFKLDWFHHHRGYVGAGSLQALPVLTLLGLLMSVCGPGALMHPIGTQIENTCKNRGAIIHLKLLAFN